MNRTHIPIHYYRVIFILAGLYNLAFGIWLFYSPDTLFGLAGLPVLLPYPYFKWLAVIIAAFSCVYFYAAAKPDRSQWLIVLGLLSKIAPSLFILLMQLLAGFSTRWYLMLFFNDMIWWIPFVLFIRSFKKESAAGRNIIP